MMGGIFNLLGLCVLSLNLFLLGVSADDDEVRCVDLAMEEFTKCQGSENTQIDFDVTVDVDEEGHGTFNGKVIVKDTIYQGAEISITMYLKTPNGNELIYSAGAELCTTMQDKNGLWAEFSEAMKSKCPIEKGEYLIDNVQVMLETMKSLMTEDNVGQYRIETNIKATMKTLMCVFLNAEIYVENRPKSECAIPLSG